MKYPLHLIDYGLVSDDISVKTRLEKPCFSYRKHLCKDLIEDIANNIGDNLGHQMTTINQCILMRTFDWKFNLNL